MMYLQSNNYRGAASKWITIPGFFDGEHESSVLPLHIACSLHAPLPVVKAIVELRAKARDEAKLWLPHMPAEWGGMGLGPTAMAAVSAEAAKVSIGPFVLNAQAPDEGNQHTLMHWATPEQKEKYLKPLCAGTAR